MSKKLISYIGLLYAFFLPLLTFLRLLFWLYNRRFFPGISFSSAIEIGMAGILFDLSTISMVIFPGVLMYLIYISTGRLVFFKAQKIVIVFFLALLILLSLFDTIYYGFSFQRINSSTFLFMSDSIRILKAVVFSEWLLISGALVLLFFSTKYMHRIFRKLVVEKPIPFKIIPCIIAAAFLLTTARGVWKRPISPLSVSLFVHANYASIVLNPVQTLSYSFLRSKYQNRIEVLAYTDAQSEKNDRSLIRQSVNAQGKPYNVIIFIMESFSRGYLEKGNPNKVYTPFLDSLIQESLNCTNAYSNGSMSVSGIQAILTGIPALYYPSIDNSPYYLNFLRGMPSVFQERGYETYFYYGAGKDHFGLEKFTKKTGIQHYISSDDYGNSSEHNGFWGIHDSAFFSFAASDIKKIRPPFFSVIYNLSTHYPYVIPERYHHSFPKGKSPAALAISYYDRCIQEFFETNKNESWFQNTLFVFVADHWNKEDATQNAVNSGRFQIPLFIHKPDRSLRGSFSGVVDQTDVFPTLMDLTGYSGKFTSFGRSILDTSEKRWTVAQKEMPSLLLFTDSETECEFDASTGKMIALHAFKGKTFNGDKESILHRAKSFVQTYNYLFINNKLADTIP